MGTVPEKKQYGKNKINGTMASNHAVSGVNGLLHIIQNRVGCLYLSDLHSGNYDGNILEVVKKLSPEEFTVDEWKEAILYITHITSSYEDSESIQHWFATQWKQDGCE